MVNNNYKREILTLSSENKYRKKAALSLAVATVTAITAVTLNFLQPNSDGTSAVTCTDATCNTNFQVNVNDTLSVSLTTPESGATGNVGSFLRNTVSLDVDSNASNGFTASMYSSADNEGTTKTNLTHEDLGDSYYLSTLSSSTTRGDFPTDSWGYSLKTSPDSTTYGETDAGNNNSYYYPLTDSDTNPITVLSAGAGTKTGSQNIYFGAKASASKPAGTYNNTVVISVVTGNVDSSTNPITPTNPVTPSTDIPNDNIATYTGSTGTGATAGVGISGTTGTTVYTTSTRTGTGTTATTTTTTEVSGGDNTATYAQPHGVQTTNGKNVANIEASSNSSSPLPAALAAAAAASATTGLAFFILAKKRNDDEDE